VLDFIRTQQSKKGDMSITNKKFSKSNDSFLSEDQQKEEIKEEEK